MYQTLERDRTFPAPPTDSSQKSSPSTTIYFCSSCDKPFTNATSRDRHLRYCGRHTRNRPRSCRACNAAKTKCSFEVPCVRCAKKGNECVYDASVSGPRALSRSAAATQRVRVEPSRISDTLLDSEALQADDEILSTGDFAFADDLGVDDLQSQYVSGNKRHPIDLTTQRPPFAESFAFEGLLACEDDALGLYECSTDLSLAFDNTLDHGPGSWCTWMRDNVSLAVVTENSPAKSNPSLLSVTQLGRTHAQHNADLIIQSLRSFPTMMLRRETFPWFIHPHLQILSKSNGPCLPEALSNCMSIAQMFASRTSETKHFLRRTIGSEHRRFVSEMSRMSNFELLAAMQACMIYLIIYIVDYTPEDEVNARELLLASNELYTLFKEVGGGCKNQSEVSNFSTVWEDWIFAESQTRFANLWLLVGCVVCVKNGNICDASQSYRALPLPSPKPLWEAPTQSAWQAEYEACRMLQTGRLVNLGHLIDAQQSDHTPSNARKLDKWNAGVDNLGCLLNLVGTMA